MQKIRIILLAAFFIFVNCEILSAYQIDKIIIKGCTIESLKDSFADTKGDMSEKDIQALGARLTDAYHESGFTTSYVEKFVVTQNTLEIFVKESRITGIEITGVNEEKKRAIKADLESLNGEIYNRYILEKTIERIQTKRNLGSVKIYPVNYKDSGDVFLSVNVKDKSAGKFYGGINVEPIYGIAPEAGYFYPFKSSAVDLFARLGFRDGEVRRAEADAKYFLFAEKDTAGFYLEGYGSRYIDIWESRDHEYKSVSAYPAAGYKSLYEYLLLDVSYKQIFRQIIDYDIEYVATEDAPEKKYNDYDGRLCADLEITDKWHSLTDYSDLKISVWGGYDKLTGLYVITSGDLMTKYSPVVWLKLIPNLHTYYTSSGERLFWQYVYDMRLLGFYDDFTASRFKNTAGTDVEFEASPDFFYIGPFVNAGYFIDEEDDWRFKTGGGIKSRIVYRKLDINIYYAWDLSKGPSSGGISIMVDGRF